MYFTLRNIWGGTFEVRSQNRVGYNVKSKLESVDRFQYNSTLQNFIKIHSAILDLLCASRRADVTSLTGEVFVISLSKHVKF
jgi:hypothetical protein